MSKTLATPIGEFSFQIENIHKKPIEAYLGMIVQKTSVFPAVRDIIFQKLRQLESRGSQHSLFSDLKEGRLVITAATRA